MDCRNIYIPSHKRAGVPITLSNFTPYLLERSTLVVQHSEAKAYQPVSEKFGVPLLVLPKAIQRLSPTLAHLVENTPYEKFFFCDDDLSFAYREHSCLGDSTLTKCNGSPVLDTMYDTLSETLEEYAHVAISSRAGNNHVESDPEGTWKYVGRATRFVGYRTEEAQWISHDRVEIRADFDRTLQLLRMGFPNAIWYDYCHDDPGSNTAGGCSQYRDHEMLDKEAHKLKSFHPGFVNVVERTTKGSWGGGTRTDVNIQWKKAYEKGRY